LLTCEGAVQKPLSVGTQLLPRLLSPRDSVDRPARW
jgi:hypothetical protein